MSEETKQPEVDAASPEQTIESVLSQVDMEKVTADEIFQDIFQTTKAHAFRLMIGVALLEKLAAKKAAEASESTAPAPEQTETPDLQVVDS
jgi:hypothetical protein